MLTDNIEDFNSFEPEIPLDNNSNDNLPYNFVNGNLDGDAALFMTDFQRPKEDMGITEAPDGAENEDPVSENEGINRKTARATAKFLTNIIDEGAAQGLSLISLNEPKMHRATDDAKKNLENILTEYVQETGGNIPLSVQVLLCILTMYIVQIPGALRDRRINKENKILENGTEDK